MLLFPDSHMAGLLLVKEVQTSVLALLRCVERVSFNLQTGNHGKEREVDMSNLKINLLKCNSSDLCLQVMW